MADKLEKLLRKYDQGIIILKKNNEVTAIGTDPLRMGYVIQQAMAESDEMETAFTSAVLTRALLDKEYAQRMEDLKEAVSKVMDEINSDSTIT